MILTAAFPVLLIVNLIENWGEKVDENGDLGRSSFVMSSQQQQSSLMAHAMSTSV